MFNRLYLSPGKVGANAAATIDPTLDLCTRYPVWLGGRRQCGVRSLPNAPYVVNTGNGTPDLLILSPTPYPLDHMLIHNLTDSDSKRKQSTSRPYIYVYEVSYRCNDKDNSCTYCWCCEKQVSLRRLQIPVEKSWEASNALSLHPQCAYVVCTALPLRLYCIVTTFTWSAFRAPIRYVYFVQPLNSRGGSALKIGLSMETFSRPWLFSMRHQIDLRDSTALWKKMSKSKNAGKSQWEL